MRFSIRALLAFTFLVGLALLAWRTLTDVRRNQARAEMLRDEIKSLEVRVRLDDPKLHQSMGHISDEYESLHAMSKRGLAHFDALREKYSTIEPRNGKQVFSLRGIPSLHAEPGPAPVVFRMIVPEERPVWLKFGIHMVDQSVHSSRTPDETDDLLTDTPFDDSGPFEIRLPAGDQMLTIVTGSAGEGSLPVEILLDDRVLVRTKFVSPDVSGSDYGHISAPSQIDFGPRRDLPWLLTTHMNLKPTPAGSRRRKTHAFAIWLSDKPSDFASFPGE